LIDYGSTCRGAIKYSEKLNEAIIKNAETSIMTNPKNPILIINKIRRGE
jgi:hypothetical protein